MNYLFLLIAIMPSLILAESKAPKSMHDLSKPAPRDTNNAIRDVFLMDMKERKAKKVERDGNGELKLLPNRVYLRYDETLKKDVFDITTKDGKFKTPARYLLPLSDIPAKWAGGAEGKAFVFDGPPKKGWDAWREVALSDSNNRYMFWNFTDPPGETVHAHSGSDE